MGAAAGILDGDWTFVTKNSVDFRGPPNASEPKGEYRKTTVHAGLICLNGPVGMDLEMQIELFEAALEAVEWNDDLINQVIEVRLDHGGDAEIRIVRYMFPSE